MMGRITDYDAFAWCYTCDHMYSWDQYNRDANMCKSCALVTEREEEEVAIHGVWLLFYANKRVMEEDALLNQAFEDAQMIAEGHWRQ